MISKELAAYRLWNAAKFKRTATGRDLSHANQILTDLAHYPNKAIAKRAAEAAKEKR